MGLTPVAPDQLATVVTTLEMRAPPTPRSLFASPLRLVEWERPAPDKYRMLFRRVGSPWLWYSRLVMDEARLRAIIHDPAVSIWAAVDPRGSEVGMVELDFRQPATCEIAYFALVPELARQELGRWLMAETLVRAWQPGIALVWLHTCTLDHPSALNFYRAQGFEAVRRTIETFADPRARGLLPVDAAPQIPYLASRR